MINKILNNENYKNKIVPIGLFLVIELMFLLAFNLGDLGVAYRLIAFLLALVILPTYLKQLNEDIGKGFIFVFLPLVIYLLSMAFSPVFISHPDNLLSPTISLLNRGFFTLLMSFIGAVSFLLLGYFVSRTNILSKINFIFLIYGGVAILLFVSLAATLMNYGFFHRLIYADKVNYFEGHAYLVINQANLLQGFNIVTVDYHVLISLALITITPLFAFAFYKEINTSYKLLLAAIGVVGLLTIIFLVDFKALLFLVPAAMLALMLKFNIHKMKHFKVVLLSGLGLGVFLIFIGVLAALEVGFVETILNSNYFIHRVFYNGYTVRYMGIIKEAFDPNYLFGNPYNYSYANVLIFPSGNIILDTVKETGIVGAISFVALTIFAVKIAVNYINNGQDGLVTKYMVTAFLLTLFTRYMLRYAFNQLSFTESYWQINYFPFVESKEFAISLFLIGYMYIAKPQAKVKKSESEELASEK